MEQNDDHLYEAQYTSQQLATNSTIKVGTPCGPQLYQMHILNLSFALSPLLK